VLIDCDTCTVRGPGCDDCVVTVLLGAPPGWRDTVPTVVPLTRRPRPDGDVPDGPPGEVPSAVAAVSGNSPGCRADAGDPSRIDSSADALRPVVELDDVERRAVRALADFGLVPPLRHQDASTPSSIRRASGDRHVS
jgi:hypothetical protein